MIIQSVNQLIAEIYLQLVDLGGDERFDLWIDQIFWDLEFFTENIKYAVTSNETNENNVAIGNFIKLGQLRIAAQPLGFIIGIFYDF